jgi:hypothetical protein
MQTLYNGAVAYERIKSFIASIVLGLIGICLIGFAINTFLYPPPPPIKTSSIDLYNPPSTTQTGTLAWYWTSLIGLIFCLISYGLYFMATSQNETVKNVLAAQGAIDAFSFLSHNRGGDFNVGE